MATGTEPTVTSDEHRLQGGALGMVDIAAATMANIGPAMSFFFGFGLVAITAGVASPLTLLAAGVAIALLGNTLAQFSRVMPSTGGFISFVGRSFGGRSAVVTALLAGSGYIIAMSSVVAVSGGFLSITIKRYFHLDVPWGLLVVVLTAASVAMMVRGIAISTKLAGLFFGFEMVMLFLVAIVVIVKHAGSLTLAPFNPGNVLGGMSGLSAGFPLAIYLFIGWENSAALAEETEDPRRNIPRAIFSSVAIMVVSYLVFAYATVVGFGYDVDKLGASEIPFIDVADNTLGILAVLAYLAGLTSTLGCLIAGTNSQARLVFSAGREGLIARWIGRVHSTRRTPVNAIFTFVAIALMILGSWAIFHLIQGTPADPLTYFGEASTMGTILVLVVYFLANLALPTYYLRHRRDEFRVVQHLILPLLGAAAIAVPLYYLAKPGQAAPFNWFPWLAVVIIVVSAIYAAILVRRDPGVGDRVGSIVADHH